MEKKILPNKEMLELRGIKGSIRDVFNEVSIFISKRKLEKGLKKDLEPLFVKPVDSFVDNFRAIFQRLKEEHYVNEKKF